MPEVKDKTTGQVIAKMPYDTAGKMAAEKMVAENPGYEIKDGAQRSEQMYAGGGKTGYSQIGVRWMPTGPDDPAPTGPDDPTPTDEYEGGGKTGEVEEEPMLLKKEISRLEKEKGSDWDKKLKAEDIMFDKADTSTMKGRRELKKAKRKTRKTIRKSKRGTIKDIRKSDTLSNSEKRKMIKEERKRKRKAIKSINRISSFTGE